MRATEAGTLRVGVYMVESARPGAMTTAANDGGDDGPRPGAIWRVQVLSPRRMRLRQAVVARDVGMGAARMLALELCRGEGSSSTHIGSTELRFGASLLPRIWQFLAPDDPLVAQLLSVMRGEPLREGERVTRLELATSTLARLHSTN